LTEPKYSRSSWVVWLDIDRALDESHLDELRTLATDLPPNSVLLTTFSAADSTYGRPNERNDRLRDIFGEAIDEKPFVSSAEARDQLKMMRVLSQATLDAVEASVIQSGRSGGIVPAFRLMYKDAMPMVTVGWALPSPEMRASVRDRVGHSSWDARDDEPIITPPLTHKEILALQTRMPADRPLTAAAVRRLGFALPDGARASYSKHYLRYPIYAQLTS